VMSDDAFHLHRLGRLLNQQLAVALLKGHAVVRELVVGGKPSCMGTARHTGRGDVVEPGTHRDGPKPWACLQGPSSVRGIRGLQASWTSKCPGRLTLSV
jgi:hypothetical protein